MLGRTTYFLGLVVFTCTARSVRPRSRRLQRCVLLRKGFPQGEGVVGAPQARTLNATLVDPGLVSFNSAGICFFSSTGRVRSRRSVRHEAKKGWGSWDGARRRAHSHALEGGTHSGT